MITSIVIDKYSLPVSLKIKDLENKNENLFCLIIEYFIHKNLFKSCWWAGFTYKFTTYDNR